MTINFLGDSITVGAWATEQKYNYVSQVGAMLKCKVNSYGVCGTRIAKQKTPSIDPSFDLDFITRAREMDKSADMVFVFGGTNDYGHGDSELGKVDDSSEYTFCGAVRTLADYLISVYGKDDMCFILPLHRYDEDNPYGEFGKQLRSRPSLKKYVEAEINVLKSMGVVYLDFRNLFPVPDTDSPSEYFQDGLHPTNAGHKLIAEKICEYVISKRKV